VTPSSGREAPSDAAIQSTREGAEGGKRRHKQLPQGATMTADDDNDNNGKASSSDVVRVMTTTRSSKHQVQPPTDHIEKLLEEAYPNHVYAIKNKLWECGMMKNFMVSGSLT
jgi:hypothetical protein